jgi:hypothetical protein
MRFRGSLLTVGLVALSGAAFAGTEGAEEATLSYQAFQKWPFILPNETWRRADDYCGVSHAGDPEGFRAEQTGVMALEVDTNGDGKLDDRIKGAYGYTKLRGRDDDGERFTYAVRFKYEAGYRWSSSCAMVGKLKGQTFKLIDQNNNGSFNDYGTDAMVIGATDAASYLSRVVNLDGELFGLEVSADGAKIGLTPYEGEIGTINLQTGFESRGKLTAAIVKDGDLSFNLAGEPHGMKVPAGKYRLVSGFAERAGETVWIRGGKSRPMEVRAENSFDLEWGGPVVAEFTYNVRGDEINVPANVSFFGAAGEEYYQFKPNAKSPKILVKDANTGKLLESGRFGGC